MINFKISWATDNKQHGFLKCLHLSLSSYSALSLSHNHSGYFFFVPSYLYIFWLKQTNKTKYLLSTMQPFPPLDYELWGGRIWIIHPAWRLAWAHIQQMFAKMSWNLRLKDLIPSTLLIIVHINSSHYSGWIEHHRQDVPGSSVWTLHLLLGSQQGWTLFTSPILFY